MIDAQHKEYVVQMRQEEARLGIPFSTDDLARTRGLVDAIQQKFVAGGPQLAVVKDVDVDLEGGVLQCRVYQKHKHPLRDLPSIVYLHGGGWTINSIETHDFLCRSYADLTGAVVVAPAYAKSPENMFPKALNQIINLVGYVSKGKLLPNISSRVVVGGDSAGGNLSLASGIALRDAGFTDLAGIIVNYGVLDNDFETASYKRFGEGDFLLSTAAMKMFFQNYFGSSDEIDNHLVTPLKANLKNLPPIFISMGEADVLASENIALAEKAMASGVACDLDYYSGLMHGYIRLPHYIDRSKLALERQLAWYQNLS